MWHERFSFCTPKPALARIRVDERVAALSPKPGRNQVAEGRSKDRPHAGNLTFNMDLQHGPSKDQHWENLHWQTCFGYLTFLVFFYSTTLLTSYFYLIGRLSHCSNAAAVSCHATADNLRYIAEQLA
jgi:hypothetical protein